MEYYRATDLIALKADFSKQITYGEERFLEIHLDEIYYAGEDLELFDGSRSSEGNIYIDQTKRVFYNSDQCIDFISSCQKRNIFLTLNDTFYHILPLIHDLPQIVYIYIYSQFPDKVQFETNDYPKLRAIVHENSPNANDRLLADIETFKQDLLTINVLEPIERKTKLSTYDKSKNNESSSITQTPVDDVSIIWIEDDDKNTIDISVLENKVSSIEKFLDIDQCINHIRSLPDNIRIFFITSKLNNDLILSSIIDLTKIRFIYIFQTDENIETILNESSNKIRGIYSDINNLSNQLLKDYKEYLNVFQTTISIFDKDKKQKTLRNLHEDNARFIWFQLLVDILIKIPHNYQTIDEMLIECEKYESKTNSKQTKIYIEDFRKNYQSSKALEYYTGATFLFSLFNRALRTENIDFLFVFRFFLSDMYYQLQELYKEQFLNDNNSLELYRGQYMNINEFNIIKNNVDHLISINQFFSTTKNYPIAALFAGYDDNNKPSDMISIVFQIEIDDTRHSLKRPFASLKKISNVKDEEEILFSIGTVFRIESVENVPGNDKNWYVGLKLINDDEENETSELRNDLEKEFCDRPDLCDLGTALIKMGEYDKAERYFQMVLEYITENHPAFPRTFICLGIIYHNKGFYPKALEFYQQALHTYIERNHLFNYQEEIGLSYTHIGATYEQLGNNQLALEYLNKALEIEKLPRRISYTLNQIAVVHQNNGDYQQALEYFQKILKIDEEVRKLNKYDPVLATAYNNIGDTYHRLGDDDNALEYLQHALNIRLKGTVSTHTDLAAIYVNLGNVYHSKNCLKQALEMFDKALEIDTQALPEYHISLGITHNNICMVYLDYKDFNKALYHSDKALEIMSKSNINQNNLLYLKCQYNFGTIQSKLGNYSKALDTFEKILKIQLENFSEKDQFLCAIYIALSNVHQYQNNISKALEYLEKCLEHARISVLPFDQAKFQLYQDQYDKFIGKDFNNEKNYSRIIYEQAEKYDHSNEQNLLLTRSIKELEQTSLNDVFERITLLNTIGTTNSRQMKYEEAIKVFNDAISLYNQRQPCTLIDERHLNDLMVLVYFNAARLYYRLKNASVVIQNLEKALALALHLNEQHSLLGEIYNLLGIVYTQVRDLSKAEYYHKLSIKAAENILPHDHSDIQRYYMQIKQLQVLKQMISNDSFT